MDKSRKLTYKLLPEWIIHQEEKSLIISGGADVRFEIELEDNKPSFFSTLKYSTYFSRDALSEVDLRVLEELITAEIVVPKLQKNTVLRVAIFGGGSTLNPADDASFKIVEVNQDYDLMLIIRTNGTYSDLLRDIEYQSITRPHLFVDAAFHHTLSIGPLVFPGETACIACLQGRINTRWGDDTPPPKPLLVNRYGRVVKELIASELSRISKEDTSLTNKTMSWNLQDRLIKKDQLLKVPLCPVCTQNRIDHSGALALPWVKA